MKKYILLIFSIVFLNIDLSWCAVENPRENVVTVSIPHVQANQGDVVDVPLIVSGFANIGTFQMDMEFNPDVLEAVDVINVHPNLGSITKNLEQDGFIFTNWYSLSGASIPDGDKLFDMRFIFCADSLNCALNGSTSPIEFIESNCEVNTPDFDPIALNFEHGSVSANDPLKALSVNITGEGVVNVNGAPYTDQVIVPVGTTLTLNAIAETGWHFTGWSGDLSGAENPIDLIMNSNKEVTAHFSQPMGLVTVRFSEEGIGGQLYAFANGEPIDNGVEIEAGSDILFIAETDDGYQVIRWTINGSTIEGHTDNTFELTNIQEDTHVTVKFDEITTSTYTIKLFLEGFYIANSGEMRKTQWLNPDTGELEDKFHGTVSDLITIELHDPNNYGNPVHTFEGTELHQDGTATFIMDNSISGEFYITIRHRNHLETVSANPVNLSSTSSYDFTTAADKAYGNNMNKLQTGIWGIYAGDISQNGTIVLTDIVQVNAAARANEIGYIVTDVTGNGQVALPDIIIVNARARAGIEKKIPTKLNQ